MPPARLRLLQLGLLSVFLFREHSVFFFIVQAHSPQIPLLVRYRMTELATHYCKNIGHVWLRYVPTFVLYLQCAVV